MKKALPLILLCALLLSACAQEPPERVNGRAEDLQIGPDGLETFVIVAAGEKYGAIVSDKTRVYPQDGMPGEEDFLSGSAPDVAVTVYFDGPKSRIVTGSGEEIESQEAEAVYLTGFLKPAATVLADGTELDVWQYEHATAYAAADGTEVLRVSEPSSPADVYYSGLSLSDLGEAAQENIAAWFEARGVLYDEQAELERAYAAWSEAEDASDFQTWGLSQRIVPTAMSERVIYFLTTVGRPVGNFVMEQQRIGTAFDRETGEYIDNSELFSCPPGELASRIMELSQMSDSELTAQAEAAFSPERAVLFEDHMEINYERGTLPAEENSFTIVLDLDEDVKALLHPWAVPQETPEE